MRAFLVLLLVSLVLCQKAISEEKNNGVDPWVEAHLDLIAEIESKNATNLEELKSLEKKIKIHLLTLLESSYGDSFRRLAVLQLFTAIQESRLPFDYADQETAIETLLTPWTPGSEKDIQKILEEVNRVLTIYRAGSSMPINESTVRNGVEAKIKFCGDNPECDSIKYLYFCWLSRLARETGDWNESRRHARNAEESAAKGFFIFGEKFLQEWRIIFRANTEIYILLSQSKLSEGIKEIEKNHKRIDKTFYSWALGQTEERLAVEIASLGWRYESQFLEELLTHGLRDLVAERAANVLIKVVNPLKKKFQKENDELDAIRAHIKQLLTDSISAKKSYTKDKAQRLPKGIVTLGDRFWESIDLLFDPQFNRSNLTEAKALVNEAKKLAKTSERRGEFVPKDLYIMLDRIENTAEKISINKRIQLEELSNFFSEFYPSLLSITLAGEVDDLTALHKFSTSALDLADGLIEDKRFLSKSARSFLYKIYADSVQKIRLEFPSKQFDQLRNFTNKHKERLRTGSEFFGSNGDTTNSEALARVVKENAFQEYLRSRLNPLSSNQIKITLTHSERVALSRLRGLRSEILSLQREGEKANRTPDKSRADEIDTSINRAWNDLKAEIAKLRFANSGAFDSPLKVTADVGLKAPIVYATVRDNKVTLLLKDLDRTDSASIDIDRYELRRLVFELLTNLSKNDSQWEASLRSFNDKLANKLYGYLGSFKSNDVYLVPDDVLALVPWSLVNTSFNKKISGILILGPEGVKTTQSAQIESQKDRVLAIDAFVNSTGAKNFTPLPYAASEGRFLTTFPFKNISPKSNRRLFLNQDFSAATFQQSLRNDRDIIHVATHFQALSPKTSESGFLLGDGSFANLISLSPTSGSSNTIKLLTLSACESYLSLQKISDLSLANEGMATFFSRIGVQTLIGTLWKISDQATYDFMRIFYTHLLEEKQSVSDALFNTIAILRDDKSKSSLVLYDKYPMIFTKDLKGRIESYRSPFYWAAFAAFISSSSL